MSGNFGVCLSLSADIEQESENATKPGRRGPRRKGIRENRIHTGAGDHNAVEGSEHVTGKGGYDNIAASIKIKLCQLIVIR